MGIFTEYLNVSYVNIAPLNTAPLPILPPNFDNPIIVNALLVTNLGKEQPIRFSLECFYQDTPIATPVTQGYIAYQALIPSLETETPDNPRTCNILQRVNTPTIHLPQGYFLSCFVQGDIQRIDLRMDYTLLKNL